MEDRNPKWMMKKVSYVLKNKDDIIVPGAQATQATSGSIVPRYKYVNVSYCAKDFSIGPGPNVIDIPNVDSDKYILCLDERLFMDFDCLNTYVVVNSKNKTEKVRLYWWSMNNWNKIPTCVTHFGYDFYTRQPKLNDTVMLCLDTGIDISDEKNLLKKFKQMG